MQLGHPASLRGPRSCGAHVRGTMPDMTDQAERYDQFAAGYARWWAPVLAPAVGTLIDRLDPGVVRTGARLLDVGTGTGQLAIAALERWPTTTVDGVDVSAGMMIAAKAEADRRLAPARRPSFRTTVATADRLPFDDGSFDLALASFVLQLVPNRHRALRDIRRVVRPGGTLRVGHVDRRSDRVRPGRGVRRCARGRRRGAARVGRPVGRLRAASRPRSTSSGAPGSPASSSRRASSSTASVPRTTSRS